MSDHYFYNYFKRMGIVFNHVHLRLIVCVYNELKRNGTTRLWAIVCQLNII